MANVLAIGILAGQRHPGSRPFLLGFETFGAIALAAYITWVILNDAPTVTTSSYARVLDYCYTLLVDPAAKTIGRDRPAVSSTIRVSGIVVLLTSPQLAVALIGGFLSLKFLQSPRSGATSRSPEA